MPIPLTYPGVYVQELPNPVRPIVGVPTSVAAFVGVAPRGVVDYPYQVNSWAGYENEFGSLSSDWPLSYAVYLFFLNGGATALIVRDDNPDDTVNYSTASVSLAGSSEGSGNAGKTGNPGNSGNAGNTGNAGNAGNAGTSGAGITLRASGPGAWGTQLWATVDNENLLTTSINQFNLTVRQVQGQAVVAQEVYPGANLQKGTPQYLPTLLAASQLVTAEAPSDSIPLAPTLADTKVPGTTIPGVKFAAPWESPKSSDSAAVVLATAAKAALATGADPVPGPALKNPLGDPDQKTGIYALTKADIFNILCLPGDPTSTYDASEVLEPAAAFCVQQRAMLILDPPATWNKVPLDFPTINGNLALTSPSANAAVYYPNLTLTDETGATITVGPCGAVAGVWAATDSSRGVWKAPAGTAATLTGIADFTAHVDDGESGTLNPLAVNALRTMPAVGPVVWGARTTVGADQAQNQWKYLPVRRIALFIEESLRRGTQWAVFEPNDEPLWSSLRLNVTTFMQGLFSQGAFQGSTPADAYLVQCDANNNPQAQIDLGIVNILVGFAPLYPAEFVIINIQQQAGKA